MRNVVSFEKRQTPRVDTAKIDAAFDRMRKECDENKAKLENTNWEKQKYAFYIGIILGIFASTSLAALLFTIKHYLI